MKFKYQIPVLIFILSGIPFLRIASQDVGIGTTTPEFKLDIAGRARLRHEGGAFTAGLWFNKSDNTAYTFAGMRSDSIWGLYAIGYKFNFDMENSRLGIGAIIPQYPLAFENGLGDKISLFGGGGVPNADHYGFGIQSSLMQLFTPASNTDIAFGYGRSAAFTERMRIKGNGNVGIGISSPLYRLDVDHSVPGLMRLTNNTTLAVDVGVEMYFKAGSYYTGAIKTIGTGTVDARLGLFTNTQANPAALIERLTVSDIGNVGIGTNIPAYRLDIKNTTSALLRIENSTALNTNISSEFYFKTGTLFTGAIKTIGTASNAARLGFFTFADASPVLLTERLSILDNGNVGIGTSVPGFILDVNGRMRIRHNGISPGIWLANSTNTNDVGFIGLLNDTHIGLYGDNGAGWDLVMNTTTGNVGIGTVTPAYPLEVIGNSTYAGRFENTNASGSPAGILGRSIAATDGYGVLGEGKLVGATGKAIIAGTGNRYGVTGEAANGTGNNFGVQAWATGGSAAMAVWALASGGTTNWAGYFAGDVYTTGTYQSSDRKLKNEILPLNHALSIINQLKAYEYTYKTNEYKQMQLPEGIQYGLIADEVMQVLPGVVKRTIQPAQYEKNDEQNGRKLSDEVEFNSVNYTGMIPILIGAIQEQQKQIEHQQKQIDELKNLVFELALENDTSRKTRDQ